MIISYKNKNFLSISERGSTETFSPSFLPLLDGNIFPPDLLLSLIAGKVSIQKSVTSKVSGQPGDERAADGGGGGAV